MPRRENKEYQYGIRFYSWRGFNTPPDLRSALCRGYKGIKPESNTTREQHTPGLCPEVVDFEDEQGAGIKAEIIAVNEPRTIKAVVSAGLTAGFPESSVCKGFTGNIPFFKRKLF